MAVYLETKSSKRGMYSTLLRGSSQWVEAAKEKMIDVYEVIAKDRNRSNHLEICTSA